MSADLLAMPLTGLAPMTSRPSEPQVSAAGGTTTAMGAGAATRAALATSVPVNAAADRAGSAFPPLLLLASAVVVWFGFQTVQLAIEYRQIGQVEAGLRVQTEAATRVRAALDAVASATARLANDGNLNARAVVEELRRRGVTIDPAKILQKP